MDRLTLPELYVYLRADDDVSADRAMYKATLYTQLSLAEKGELYVAQGENYMGL